MDPLAVVGLGLLGMFVLIGLHVPIGVAMAITGVTCFALLVDLGPALATVKNEAATAFGSRELLVIPLFILMGGFATAAGMSSDIYRLASAIFGRLRGGLALATVGACAGFGAINGSSIATTATMTRVALPQMLARGYSAELAAGSIAAGGSLGMLIPPSIIMVLYAILTEQSVLAMFAAAISVGFLAVLFYFIAIMIVVAMKPESGPPAAPMTWEQRGMSAVQSWRVLILAGVVSGGIYGGFFTVSEAAAIGCALAFAFFAASGRLTPRMLTYVLGDAAATTSMIFVVVVGANAMTYFVTVSGAPGELVSTIEGMNLHYLAVIALLMLLFIILGSIFDTTAGMVITLPFVYPLILGLSFGGGIETTQLTETEKAIWWGIMMVVLIELGMITPPIGLNVFVLHGMTRGIPLTTVFKGVTPFIVADLARLIVIALFPDIVLYIPRQLGYL